VKRTQIIDIQIEGLDDALRAMGRKQLKPAYREAWDSENPRDGFCYVIAELIYHYKNPGGFSPRVIKWDDGTTHWFLANDAGDIIDPGNLDAFPWPNYAEGKPKHFLTKEPSKRAKILANLLGLIK
jgi:hypothetical protein